VHGFDDFAAAQCSVFFADTMGTPSLPPGIYFRELIGYFHGIDSEQGIAWRAADSFAPADVLGSVCDTSHDQPPISRTRRLTDLEMHRAALPGSSA
jgi:transposase